MDSSAGATTMESKTNFFRPSVISGTVLGDSTPLHKGHSPARAGRTSHFKDIGANGFVAEIEDSEGNRLTLNMTKAK